MSEGAQKASTEYGSGTNRTITDPEKIAAIDADVTAANAEALNVSGTESKVVAWAKQKSTALYSKHKVEFGGTIVRDGDTFGIGRIVTDYQTGRLPSLSGLSGYAHFHTHPGSGTFSSGDISVAVVNRLNKSYVFPNDGSTHTFNSAGYRQVHDWRSLRHFMSAEEAATASQYINAR